eukprot:1157061-Pelagomonas_calceolata.AAC.5
MLVRAKTKQLEDIVLRYRPLNPLPIPVPSVQCLSPDKKVPEGSLLFRNHLHTYPKTGLQQSLGQRLGYERSCTDTLPGAQNSP